MNPLKINEVKDGVILEVNVKPQARAFKIVVENGEITVFCVEEPVKGKVNKEIIKELSKFFNRNVELISGFTSKKKILLITGLRKVDVEQVLQR